MHHLLHFHVAKSRTIPVASTRTHIKNQEGFIRHLQYLEHGYLPRISTTVDISGI
ncbi:hypothetical protein E2C01_066792 [Portunus trituberculatus]|uniref:Uncharacterized protein n=1 Tax=Portunus trituberculatus TaxID=210409 RepID=A0A5B7HQS1_PORTR|nr:hypothetical protein [Portunus trituberculatus]